MVSGFKYESQLFGSLSSVANKVAGGNWNGFVFFVMKLIWLALAIQEEILSLPGRGGRHPLTEHVVRRIAAPWSWAEQLKLWIELKRQLHLGCSS